MDTGKIRIVIADDHGMIRQGLRLLLENETGVDIEVVGQAEDGQAAVDLALELSPDMLLTDVSMPNLNGIEATRIIMEKNPNIRVLGLSAHTDMVLVSQMLKAGARGYVLKDSLIEELVEAIHTVMAGGIYLSPAIAAAQVDEAGRAEDDIKSPLATLSRREMQVLQRIGQGMDTKQVAAALGISVKTVDAHRRGLMEKLHAHTVADLVRIAIRTGLTTID